MFKRQSSVFDENNVDEVDHLLTCVKRQVKQIMEESVTKKFIHEDSSSVTTLCGAVEACLKHRLRKQTINLFNSSSSTTVLLHKISKYSDDAKKVYEAVTALEGQGEPFSRFSLKNLTLESKQSPKHTNNSNGLQKYAWIRIALFSRLLANIVSHLVTNSSKYYEPGSLLADQAKGSLLAQLLEGPCALEYSRMRTSDHLYTDPNADELVLRHRLHSNTSVASQSSLTSPYKRPALGIGRARCSTSSSSEDSMRSVPAHAREYVESLHQNQKTNLLYGKNNVKVLPKDGNEPLPGYLSLHQTSESLSLKWTPNQLINSNSKRPSNERMQTHLEERSPIASQCTDDGSHGNEVHKRDCTQSSRLSNRHPPLMWDCAINVMIDEIVYLHCHHHGACGGTLILVGADGVQSPAFDFPFGGHLLAFLACLESGLQPHAQLDPPLWIHKDTGKIFPKLKKKLSKSKHSASEGGEAHDPQPLFSDGADIDYVFRIVSSYKPKGLHELVDPRRLSFPTLPLRLPWTHPKPITSGRLQSKISSNDNESASLQANGNIEKPPLQARDSLQKLCDTMKTRILSRAFYGWLAHCRHLKTVREHLSGLVYNNETTLPVPAENEKHLSTEFWNRLSDTDMVFLQVEIYRRIYYGGMSHDIRKQVWPYLLGHYKFGCTKTERRKIDVAALKLYENLKEEWMSIEALLKQRKEMARTSHKTSESEDEMESTCEPAAGVPTPENFRSCLLERQTSALSNDVFLDTVIVGDVTSEPFRGSTKPHPPLTKWHTVDSNYREDFCSIKMSHTYGGFRRHSLDDENEAELSPLVKDAAHDEKILEEMDVNLHRIDKDVHRCDRSYWYFSDNNLKKLRNVMCTYVWRNLDVGYVQGMCDLVAPLLVIFDDESLTYSCFCHLMKRMVENFPNGTAMDNHLANMRSLIRVLDPELYDLMQQDGEYAHFFFCYRWLLLDFKREMCYDDVFLVWESIWSAKHICSENYVAFVALGMIEAYREILLDNSMDFIDAIKFFNEMAEKHDAKEVLSIARELVFKLQSLIELK